MDLALEVINNGYLSGLIIALILLIKANIFIKFVYKQKQDFVTFLWKTLEIIGIGFGIGKVVIPSCYFLVNYALNHQNIEMPQGEKCLSSTCMLEYFLLKEKTFEPMMIYIAIGLIASILIGGYGYYRLVNAHKKEEAISGDSKRKPQFLKDKIKS